MTGLALMEVQHALYTKLHGDGVLMSMVTGIFDAEPQKTALPYIVIGDGSLRELPAEGVTLSELTLQIDVWTDASGRKSALTILNRLFAVLHLGTLTLAGLQQVILRCNQADTALMEEHAHVHGSLTLKATVVE
jgi:hypothetical protein